MAARIGLFNFPLARSERDDHRLVAGGPQKHDQVGRGEAGRARVDERVKIEPGMPHHARVQHNGHPTLMVVDRAERRDRTRPNAPNFLELLGRTEGDAPLRSDLFVHALQVDDVGLAERQEEQTAFFVFQEKVLCLTSRDYSPQRARILDRMERRMLDRRRRDAELVEVGEQVFGGLGHGSLGHGSLDAGSRVCKTFSRRIEPRSTTFGREGGSLRSAGTRHCQKSLATTISIAKDEGLRRFLIFALLGPPLGMITGMWGILPVLNWSLRDAAVIDYP